MTMQEGWATSMNGELTHWPLADLNKILYKWFSKWFQWLMAGASLVKLPSDECHCSLLMIRQHWIRWWLGAVRQQAITWANVDPDLCRHVVSLGHNELNWDLEPTLHGWISNVVEDSWHCLVQLSTPRDYNNLGIYWTVFIMKFCLVNAIYLLDSVLDKIMSSKSYLLI